MPAIVEVMPTRDRQLTSLIEQLIELQEAQERAIQVQRVLLEKIAALNEKDPRR